MAAGLGFKNFVTGDVLTAADTNGYLMQGVWVFANAAARTAAVTSPQEGNASFLKDTNSLEIYDGAAWVAYGAGDITGVTAGTGITGGGTSGTVTITNDMATKIDAKGDLVVGTGADTYDRLAVGTNAHVLTADSTTGTGLKWAAVSSSKSFSLLNGPSGTTLTGSGTITVSHGSGYDQLYILVLNASSASASSFIELRFNADSGSNYNWYGTTWAGDAAYSAGYMGGTGNSNASQFRIGIMSGSASSTVNGGAYLFGANTSGVKMAQILGSGGPASNNGHQAYNAIGYYNSSSVISSTSLISTVGNFDGGTLFIYGAA